jgi:hypothetical protein
MTGQTRTTPANNQGFVGHGVPTMKPPDARSRQVCIPAKVSQWGGVQKSGKTKWQSETNLLLSIIAGCMPYCLPGA